MSAFDPKEFDIIQAVKSSTYVHVARLPQMMKLMVLCTGPTYCPNTPLQGSLFCIGRRLGAAMRRLWIAIIAAALTVVCAQVASAADMPVKAPRPVAAPPPVYNWTGFYVGGHVGYLWGRTHVEEDGVVAEDGVPTNGVVGGALAG